MKTNTANNNNIAAASVEQTSGQLPHDERRRSNRVFNKLSFFIIILRAQTDFEPGPANGIMAKHLSIGTLFARAFERRSTPMTLSNSFRLRASPSRPPSESSYASPFHGDVKTKRRQSQIKKLYIVYVEAWAEKKQKVLKFFLRLSVIVLSHSVYFNDFDFHFCDSPRFRYSDASRWERTQMRPRRSSTKKGKATRRRTKR